VSLALVIGGTRSGKSAHAERLAQAVGGAVTYVATAEGSDPAMAERIRRHVERRPPSWTTVQAGDRLAAALGEGLSLIDGLGPWIAGVLHRRDRAAPGVVVEQIERLIEAARTREVIVVAEEAGQGLLPGDPLSRAWLDLLGEATQRLAGAAARVDYVLAGCAITISGGAVGGAGPGAGAAAGAGAGPGAGAAAGAGTVAGAGASASPVVAELRRHGDRFVRPGELDHAVNVLEPGPPPWLARCLSDALAEAARGYPDERGATAALAALHGRDRAEIVPTNGAAEALWLLGPALRPRLAACVHPSFTETEAGLRAHGVPVVRVQRDPDADFRLDPGAVPADADLVIVGNPVSPSGTLDCLQTLIALRAPGRTVVVDEAFMPMVPGEPQSLARSALEDVIVIRSLTKLLSLPGLRVGYVIAPPRLARALRGARAPWSANALALIALAAAAEHPGELRALAERAAAQGADLGGRLRTLPGVRTWPSVTNFSLVETAAAAAVLRALREAGIAVRPAASFPGLDGRHIRITAREPERNARLVAVLAEALG
jgi:histidinol-phosphate/aromatic aminotransferase/cobyric acid decarboxylase-like protein/adenosyl cobinamide kinase/adenosyl cobinamide phosphate guanylyltransferase